MNLTGSILKKIRTIFKFKKIEKQLANKKEEEENKIKDENKKNQEKDKKGWQWWRREKSNNIKIKINKISFRKLWSNKKIWRFKKIILDINERIKD